MADKPWGGRFSEKTNKLLEDFSASIEYDKRLYPYDIQGSIAHCRMLAKQEIISAEDGEKIVNGLDEILDEIESGNFVFSDALEDIHMNIEARLIEKIGDPGGKLHTARSRNDQVALDTRLYLRAEIRTIVDLLKNFQVVLLKEAQKHKDLIMPGYTHLQRAQPVLFSNHLMAYYEMFGRDAERFEDCLKRVNVMPLGAGALAGTTFPIDREFVAELLDFPTITRNSLDSVSDRDFIIEFNSISSILMMHLSRLSEELVLWVTEEFGVVELADAFCTGSSIMPQKKNPDIPELVRGKTGRVFGNLVAILTVMKGLPLAYNRDMQEDKEPLFDTVDTVKNSLSIFAEMMGCIKVKREKLFAAADGGYSTATEIADYLVRKGLPFRDAHAVVGKIVGYCVEKGIARVSDITLSQFNLFSDLIEEDIYEHVDLVKSTMKKADLFKIDDPDC